MHRRLIITAATLASGALSFRHGASEGDNGNGFGRMRGKIGSKATARGKKATKRAGHKWRQRRSR